MEITWARTGLLESEATGWTGLTVPNAAAVSDFYAGVVGWRPQPVDRDGYEDFGMDLPDDGPAVAGVCHARGPNAGLPSMAGLRHGGGHRTGESSGGGTGGGMITGIRRLNGGRMCVIRDPAGALLALFQTAP